MLDRSDHQIIVLFFSQILKYIESRYYPEAGTPIFG